MKSFDVTLYGILDPEHSGGRNLPGLARTAADNGVTILQLRDKVSATRQAIQMTREIAAALEGTGVPLIVNDRVDVALAAGAAGVHLGQEDMEARDARRLLGPDAIIGLSVKTEADARTAPVEAIDYAFIGGVHPTTSKKNPAAIGVEGWKALAAILRARKPLMPTGAIAGFTRENIPAIFEAGSNGVALISALFEADDVAASCRSIRAIIDTAVRARKEKGT